MTTNPQDCRFVLNCFAVDFSVSSITAFQSDWTEGTDLRDLRKSLGSDWFLLRRGNVVWGLPTVPSPATKFGGITKLLLLSEYDGLDFMRARLDSSLPGLLPAYVPQHVRPFRFLAQRDEFVSAFAATRQVPELVRRGFSIRPRFELEARTIELVEGELRVVVALSLAMQWDSTASLRELSQLNIPLEGLYVILKNPQPGQRRLIGRISGAIDDKLTLDESMDERTSVDIDAVQLEGSKVSFKRCLSRLLGTYYTEFENERDRWESSFTTGPSFRDVLERFSKTPRSVLLAPGVTATIGPAVHIHNVDGAKVYVELPPVEYCFDAAKTKRKTIPWDGLVEFGPYDSDTFDKRTPRIMVVVPQTEQNKAEQVFGTFRDGCPGSPYPVGFARLFNLRQVKFDTCPIPDQRLAQNQFAGAYRAAIESHLSNGTAYDAAFVVVPDFSRQMPDAHNPYLHAKALLLTNGIPSQQLRIGTLHQSDTSVAYALRNIAVAVYAKMDGAPWTVSQPRTYNDEIVIGMGMAEVAR